MAATVRPRTTRREAATMTSRPEGSWCWADSLQELWISLWYGVFALVHYEVAGWFITLGTAVDACVPFP